MDYGEMKLSEVKKILEAEVLVGEDQLERIVAGGGSADLMSDVLAAVAEDAVILTGLITEQVVRTAKISGATAVVFVRGKMVNEKIVERAKSYDMPILRTRFTLFVASGLLYMNGLRGLEGSW
jgi:predicted transcriptional regulator